MIQVLLSIDSDRPGYQVLATLALVKFMQELQTLDIQACGKITVVGNDNSEKFDIANGCIYASPPNVVGKAQNGNDTSE